MRKADVEKIAWLKLHELCNLMSVVAANFELAEMSLRGGGEGDRQSGLGHVATGNLMLEKYNRLSGFFDSLVIGTTCLERFSLADTVENFLQGYATRHPEQRKIIRIEDEVENLTAFGSSMSVEVALRNMIANAWDELCRHRMKEGAEIVIRICERGGKIALEVEDNGPGIPLQVRRRLLAGPVESTHRGSGHGLCGTAEMLRVCGADISFESTLADREARGRTVFTITFPALPPKSSVPAVV